MVSVASLCVVAVMVTALQAAIQAIIRRFGRSQWLLQGVARLAAAALQGLELEVRPASTRTVGTQTDGAAFAAFAGTTPGVAGVGEIGPDCGWRLRPEAGAGAGPAPAPPSSPSSGAARAAAGGWAFADGDQPGAAGHGPERATEDLPRPLPLCPNCSSAMVFRRPRGRANGLFFGCPRYPACRGTRSTSQQ